MPLVQLYNIEKDPGETQNVINEYPEIAARLITQMREYIDRGRSTPGEIQKNETQGEWKQIIPFMKHTNTGL